MAETGVLRPDARVELLNGEIIDMSPIGPFHGGLVNRLIRIYGKLSNGRWQASAQNPLRLDDHSEPEPDFMLLKPSPDDYTSRHPRPDEAFLLVEVADASLDYDLEEKLPAYGHAGVDPEFMGLGPIPASRKALQKAGLTIDDIDVIESNEAFASQACAVARDLGFPPEKVNPNGGAVALGHPIGASGAIIAIKALYELERIGGRYALATLCIGGGQGIAVVLERV